MDHAFEMLLKSAIIYRGGRIREPRQRNTIGFDQCVTRGLSAPGVKFLSNEQALVLQTLNGLRDAAQHHLLEISEEQLYLHAQSGVTLFRDILSDVFREELIDFLPSRALPLATVAPKDVLTLFATQLEEIKALLSPGRRKRTEAEARLRGLAIVDGALRGEFIQPTEGSLRKLAEAIGRGDGLVDVFPGIAGVSFTAEGSGPALSLRIQKKEGMPVVLVKEGSADAAVIAVRRVNELGYYCFSHTDVAERCGLNGPKTTAAIAVLGLKGDEEYCREIRLGKSRFDRYSQKAVDRIKELLQSRTSDEIWSEYRATRLRA